MSESIVSSTYSEKSSSPFDSIRGYREDGSEYWTGRELMKWLGYAKWQNAEKAIKRAILSLKNQGQDPELHLTEVSKHSRSNGLGVQSIVDYELSRLGCYTVAMNADPEKEMVAMAQGYFAIQTRKAEVVIPAQNDRLRELELENENLKLKANLVDITNTMVTLHGEALGLTIAGLNVGQIVEVKIPVTEVLNPTTGDCDEFLDAKQLVREVERRSGQKVKNNADFIRKLKAANRDDLILPVTRNATCEYVRSEDLDEAIEVVFGKCKQQLLKPSGSIVKR